MAKQAVTEEKTVELVVDRETGRVAARPDPLFIRAGDRVVWKSEEGPWAVHFAGVSPLRVRRVRGVARAAEGAPVREDVHPGTYKYFVAVTAGGRIYTADPDLIDDGDERPHPIG